ncbi:MAG: diguanylate cyclase [Lachnospiraceae bacterium]|nr:diguanylate cyclase [Lachnospiraceae bacterium]
MTKKELNNWKNEIRTCKYLHRKAYATKVQEFTELAKRDGDELALAYAVINQVILDFRANSLSQNTIKKLADVLQMSENKNDYDLEAECHNMLGIVASHMVDKAAGLEHFEKGYSLSKRHHLILHQSVFANNIGDTYMTLGEYGLALEYFRESYRLIMEREKKQKCKATSPVSITRINMCFMNMAEVHYRQGNYEEAVRMLSCIDGIESDNKGLFYYTSIMILRTLIYIKMGATEEVISYLDQIIADAENANEAISTLEDYIGLADVLIDAGYHDKAKRLLDASEKIVEDVDLEDKWCLFLKTKIKYMKLNEPNTDRTLLYEKYLAHRDNVDMGLKAQQLTSLKNKKRLEEEIRKRNNAEKRNRKLKALSEHDQLTGVYNRYAMLELGTAWFNEAKEKGVRLTFMIIDVDYFKEYNDTYGHLGGDEVLRMIGEVLLECTQNTDLVVRYGGDEFFIISKGRNVEDVISLGATINRKINEKKILHAASPISQYVTLSFGAVCGKAAKDQTMIDAIHFADNGLYRIKNERRNALGLFRQVDDDFEFECVKFE